MRKVLFLDRDGTLVVEPPEDFQIDSLEKLQFYPGVFQWLSRIARELDYELVMVTNQDGLGTSAFPDEVFWPAHNKIIQAFENEGIVFSEVLIDRTLPEDNAATRKPGTGMLHRYLYGNYDLSHSFVVGDRNSDIELARNIGCQGIAIGQHFKEADLNARDWEEIYRFLKSRPRTARVSRKTSETDIFVHLNLDGSGQATIETGIGFFDHMLAQVARHGGVDLEVSAEGDLHIDAHHTIEDVALTLGTAFVKALGSKKGIERYGFLLPMDDCLAQVAIDFGGRPDLSWQVQFDREMIGEMPTEMFRHFFKSFCDTAACNLHIRAEGVNEHHKIEAIFKAFARSIRSAVQSTQQYAIPSSKGVL